MPNFYGIREFDDPIERSVGAFKALFGHHTELFTWGQFYSMKLMINGIRNAIRIELLDKGVPQDRWLPYFDKQLSLDPRTVPVDVIQSDVIPSMERSTGKTFPGIRAAFPAGKPTKSDFDEMHSLVQKVWGGSDIPASVPYFPDPTIQKAAAAREIEEKNCFNVARAMARKVQGAKKISSIDPSLRISMGVIPGAVAVDAKPSPNAIPGRKIISLGNQSILESTVAKMKQALAAGAMVQCGVLSGITFDFKPKQINALPQPDHYVLAFQSGKVGDLEAFLCWDPDAVHSNVETTTWGRGFTCLFHAAGRLSTAYDDVDLYGINSDGDHIATPQRHCYQVYYLQTLPA